MLRSIEGSCFAGKSTLARQLAAIHSGIYIGEYSDYIRVSERPDLQLPTTVEEAKRSVDFLLELERRRTQHIRRGIAAGRVVISDRTVLTLAAYHLALERKQHQLTNPQPAIPDYTLTNVQKAIEQGDVEMPERLLLLQAADETTHYNRVAKRGPAQTDAFNHWFFAVEVSRATEEAAEFLLGDETKLLRQPSHDGPAAFTANLAVASEFFALPPE